MRKLLLLILLFASVQSFAQINVEINADSIVLRKADGYFRAFTQITSVEASPNVNNGLVTYTGAGYSYSLYVGSVLSLKVNGVVQPVTFNNLSNSFKGFAASHGGGSSGGGGAGTLPPNAATESSLQNANDSSKVARDLQRNLLVKQDSANAIALRNENKQGGISDSVFLKQIANILKDSSGLATLKLLLQLHKDSSTYTTILSLLKTTKDSSTAYLTKRLIDSIGRNNTLTVALAKEATLLQLLASSNNIYSELQVIVGNTTGLNLESTQQQIRQDIINTQIDVNDAQKGDASYTLTGARHASEPTKFRSFVNSLNKEQIDPNNIPHTPVGGYDDNSGEARILKFAGEDVKVSISQPININNTQFGATQVGPWSVNQSLATAGFGKITNGTNTAGVIAGGISVVGAIEPALVTALSPNSADINPNRTIGTSAFSKITDGTTNGVIKPSTTTAVLADPSLVVQSSPNNYIDQVLQYQATTTTTGVLVGDFITRYMRTDLNGTFIKTANYNLRTGALINDASLLSANGTPIYFPNSTLPTSAFSKITDGTNTASVKAGSTAAIATDPSLVVAVSPNNTVKVKASDEDLNGLHIIGAPLQSVAVNNVLNITSGVVGTDLIGYNSAVVTILSTATGGQYIFEASNDNFVAHIVPIQVRGTGGTNGSISSGVITATASSFSYEFSVKYRYYRLRISTTLTGGSIQTFSRFSKTSYAPDIVRVANNTAGDLQATVTGTLTGISNPVNIANATPTSINDVVSGAITTTATTIAFTPASGKSFQVIIPVTAVSGTSPTMQVGIEVSSDGGANWRVFYVFPLITQIGVYYSPRLPVNANRIRYYQILGGGGTPSFTRSITRSQNNDDVNLAYAVENVSVAGTIGTANVVQNLMALNPARQGFEIQNKSTTAILHFKIGGTATASNGFKLTPGQSYSSPATRVSTNFITIVGDVAGSIYEFIEY